MPINAGHVRRRPPSFGVWSPFVREPSVPKATLLGSGTPAVAGGGVDGPTTNQCGGVAAVPIRRLNRFEYDNTLPVTQREVEGAP